MTDYVVSARDQFDASLATIETDIGQLKVRALLDSGSSVSLIVADLVKKGCYEIYRNYFKQLVSATGNNLEVMGKVLLPILIGGTQTNHEFTVVSSLVTPLILGKDFLSAHKIRLDFGKELIECPLGFISPFDPKKVVVSRSNLMSNQVEFKDSWKEGQDIFQVHDKFLRPFPGSVSLIRSEPESSGCEECYIPCFNQEKFELRIILHSWNSLFWNTKIDFLPLLEGLMSQLIKSVQKGVGPFVYRQDECQHIIKMK